MRILKILPAVVIITAVLVFAGCSHGRYYEDDHPRYRSSVSLIISPSPGFVMQPHPSGAFYHRGPYGVIYWRGYDNRFYLDRRYLHRARYSNYEYREWKLQGRRYGRRNNRW